MKRFSMIGLGYIGLPTAILAAQHGYEVLGFDIDEEKINAVNDGKAPFFEPGLEEALSKVTRNGSFHAYSVLQPADYFVIAVPTPFKHDQEVARDIKEADLSYVQAAIESVALKLAHGNTVIIESTIPVGTTDAMTQLLEQKTELKAGSDFFVAHCPERVLPGKIFEELVANDRVIGGICMQSSLHAVEFYRAFVQGNLHVTNAKTAEMVKLVENSSRDVQIAFANQVAAMAEVAQINGHEVIKLANKHPRVNILEPGCGVGGHCIAVDPWFLIETFPQESKLLQAARSINDARPQVIVDQVVRAAKLVTDKKNKKAKVAVLGLTYKPDVDDLRESPALQIARTLAKFDEFELVVCDPNLSNVSMFKQGFNKVVGLWQAFELADIVVILVKHKEFNQLISCDLSSKIIIDPSGLLSVQISGAEEELLIFTHRITSQIRELV